MTEESQLSRVEILIQQKRYPEAERLLSDLLASHSDDTYFLSLLAEVQLQQDKFDNANSIIDSAIAISPDDPDLFYSKARILLQLDDRTGAEKQLNEAINLDPYDASYFALLAHIKLVRKKFAEALETAKRALEIDPENLLALNVRSTALTKLNRTEESFETIEGALRNDPNNAYTHSNYGWSLLENGDHKKALEHFKEALSADPTFYHAHDGMLEAIKASNPVYRLFLQYTFFMGNLTAKYQWVVIIGFYFGLKALRAIAGSNPAVEPYLTPLIILLTLIAFSTWVIGPISNLFLRFNKYGKFLLDEKEKLSSNLVAGSLGLFIVGLLLYFGLSDDKMLSIAAYGFAMMLPLGTMFSPSNNKKVLIIYTAALAIVGLLAITLTFLDGALFNGMTVLFILGFLAFQWVANYILIKENNS